MLVSSASVMRPAPSRILKPTLALETGLSGLLRLVPVLRRRYVPCRLASLHDSSPVLKATPVCTGSVGFGVQSGTAAVHNAWFVIPWFVTMKENSRPCAPVTIMKSNSKCSRSIGVSDARSIEAWPVQLAFTLYVPLPACLIAAVPLLASVARARRPPAPSEDASPTAPTRPAPRKKVVVLANGPLNPLKLYP